MVVVNDAHRLFPDADLLYACDHRWWRVHEGVPSFAGPKWTQSHKGGDPALVPGLNVIESVKGSPPPFESGKIARGSNSGFQAVNLVALMGCTDIVLLGFDMGNTGGRTHFFGDHPPELQAASSYDAFIRAFELAAPIYAARGVTVRNASRHTALPPECFPRVDLECVL